LLIIVIYTRLFLHETPVKYRELRNHSCVETVFCFVLFIVQLLNSEIETVVFQKKKDEKGKLYSLNFNELIFYFGSLLILFCVESLRWTEIEDILALFFSVIVVVDVVACLIENINIFFLMVLSN